MAIKIEVDQDIEVFVNTVPLTNNVDFITIDETIAFNESGMDLNWNFITTAGVVTQTNVVPTAAGDYDWQHIGNGMYKIEIPAVAGASIGNDTEGTGFFTGKCDAILTWRSPDYEFSPANVVNSLVNGTDNLQTDPVSLDGDATAMDNLALMYDGTGYNDDTAPSSRAQVGSISSVGGGGVSFEVTEDNTGGAIKGIAFVGAQTNTFTSTEALDGVYHTIDDAAAIDIVYGFDIGGSRIATQIAFDGFLNGNNDDMNILVYDFVGVGWDTIALLDGQAGSNNQSNIYPLFTRHTGTGTDLGKVYFRIQNVGQSNPQLNTDRLLVEAVQTNATVGYEGGAIWVDTNVANVNTESFVDGTADNPVSTLAAATTLAGNLNLAHFHFLPGSTVTLAQVYDNFEFNGENYIVALGGQSVSGASFRGANITGNDDGSNAVPTFYRECVMNNNTLGQHELFGCQLAGDIVLAEAADYFWDACFSGIAGTATPSVDLQAAVEVKNLSVRHYSGGLEFLNHGAGGGTHNTSIEGFGQVILNANCAGGTIAIRGNFTVTDNAAGAVTLSDEARVDMPQINAEVDAALVDIKLDHLVAVADADDPVDDSIVAKLAAVGGDWSDFDEATDSLEAIRDRGDAAWITAPNDPTVAAIADAVWDEILTGATHNIAASAGRRLRELAGNIVFAGTAQAGSTVNTIVLDAGASAMDGAYDPSVIAIVAGTGAGQCRNILEYVGATKVAIVDRNWKVTPNATSEFVIYADAGREHVNEGFAQAGAALTITLNTLASAFNNAYNGQIVFIRSGTGEDQSRWITAYNGGTKVATINLAWDVNPDATSAYVILPAGMQNLAMSAVVDDIETRIPAALVGGAMDSAVSAVSVAVANFIADHTLRRTFANAWNSADGDAQNFRSLVGAVAKLVNRIRIAAGVLTIYEEDDVTPVDTQVVTTDALADPVIELDTT